MRLVYIAISTLICCGVLIATKASTGNSTSVAKAPSVPTVVSLQTVDTLTKTDKLSVAYLREAIEDRPAPFSDPLPDAEPVSLAAIAPKINTEGHSQRTSSIKADSPKRPAPPTKSKSPTKKMKQDVVQARTGPEQKTCGQASSGFDGLLVALNLKSRCSS